MPGPRQWWDAQQNRLADWLDDADERHSVWPWVAVALAVVGFIEVAFISLGRILR